MKIAPSKIAQLFQKIDNIEKSLAVTNMINEREAAELLNIKVKTIRVKFNRNQIPEDCYTISPVNGERFYDRAKIIGLKQKSA